MRLQKQFTFTAYGRDRNDWGGDTVEVKFEASMDSEPGYDNPPAKLNVRIEKNYKELADIELEVDSRTAKSLSALVEALQDS